MRFPLIVALSLALPAAAAEPTEVERWLDARIADGGARAAAFAVIEEADVRTRGWGHRADGKTPVDAKTQFQAGSITKAFTNLLLAEMVADDATGTRYTTTLGDAFGEALAPHNAAVTGITFEQLATHTSGLPRLPANMDPSQAADPYRGYDAKDLIAGLNATRDKQPLGRFYSYSNFGVAVLGEALGRLDGRGYREALTARVIGPAQLERTTFVPDANRAAASEGGNTVAPWTFDAFAPAGALWTSADDLAQLVGTSFGRTNSLAHDRNEDSVRVADAGGFGVSRVWHLASAGDDTILWHNGATRGFKAIVAFQRDAHRGYVVLVAGDADPTEVVLRALGHEPSKPKPRSFDAAVLGQYQLAPTFGIGVFERNGVLFTQATGQMALQLHDIGNDWYALGEVDASLHALREDGKVVAIEMAQSGVLQRAKRVADAATAAARTEVDLPAEAYAEYVGEYALAPGVSIVVREREGGIQAQITGQPSLPVAASAKDRFFYRAVDAELEFSRGDDGKVDAVTLHQGSVHQRAPRRD